MWKNYRCVRIEVRQILHTSMNDQSEVLDSIRYYAICSCRKRVTCYEETYSVWERNRSLSLFLKKLKERWKKEVERKNEHKFQMEILVKDHTPLKATVIQGTRPGKCLAVTAGVHGCEYVGIQAARALISELQPEEISGTVIILPVVNESGFYHGLKQIVREDGVNLNRAFPGNVNGSVTYRIAAAIEEHLYGRADFLLDLHCGDINEMLTPLVFYPVAAGKEIEKITRDAAKRMLVPYRVQSHARNGLYSWGTQKGLPAMLLEYGCQGRGSEKEVAACKESVYNLMKHLGILSGEAKGIDKEGMGENQREIEKAVYLEAPANGFWYPKIKEGQFVEKGELLGELQDLDGKLLEQYYAESRGVILYYTLSLGVRKDDPLVAYGCL